jgi:hypothetical protein
MATTRSRSFAGLSADDKAARIVHELDLVGKQVEVVAQMGRVHNSRRTFTGRLVAVAMMWGTLHGSHTAVLVTDGGRVLAFTMSGLKDVQRLERGS